MEEKYVDYALEKLKELLAIDSPTGFTSQATHFLVEEYKNLGYEPKETPKGAVLVDLGGENAENGLLVAAHTDTLGAMVCEIKSNGNLKMTPLGGLMPNNTETENVRIYSRSGKMFEGTIQLNNASVHVSDNFAEEKRTYQTVEVVLDEDVHSKEDTLALGIMIGDIVAVEPRTRITQSGYIKSRYLDDKLSVAILLAQAKYLKEKHINLKNRTYHFITVNEEVGHGGAASMPDGVTEMLSVDMGCVGDGLDCTEHQVSICAKDSCGPFNYDMVSRLIETAKEHDVDFAVDVYPHYGCDADVAIIAGRDVRHALIGSGVYASHGYERSHIDGLRNTLELLIHFCR